MHAAVIVKRNCDKTDDRLNESTWHYQRFKGHHQATYNTAGVSSDQKMGAELNEPEFMAFIGKKPGSGAPDGRDITPVVVDNKVNL